MRTLLNLLAAIALLVWGTHIVRTGVLRVYGAGLRRVLARSMDGRATAFFAGLGVTGLLQSSTATALLTSSFVAQGLLTTSAALAVMLAGRGRPPIHKQPQPGWKCLQVTKHRSGSRLIGITHKVVYGDPGEVPDFMGLNTAYVERTNLTSRQMNGRMVRKTLSFSKEEEMLKASCALEDSVYNLTRPVKSLRVEVNNDERRWEPRFLLWQQEKLIISGQLARFSRPRSLRPSLAIWHRPRSAVSTRESLAPHGGSRISSAGCRGPRLPESVGTASSGLSCCRDSATASVLGPIPTRRRTTTSTHGGPRCFSRSRAGSPLRGATLTSRTYPSFRLPPPTPLRPCPCRSSSPGCAASSAARATDGG